MRLSLRLASISSIAALALAVLHVGRVDRVDARRGCPKSERHAAIPASTLATAMRIAITSRVRDPGPPERRGSGFAGASSVVVVLAIRKAQLSPIRARRG